MKSKKIILISLLAIGFIFLFSNTSFAAETTTGYTPLEAIPGTSTEEQKDFPSYIQAIYKFAIWTVGIAALLMISIGGFMYATAAGNNSRMETAKKVIWDALFGLIAVMVAWLILNIINPDLVKIDLGSVKTLNPGSYNAADDGLQSPHQTPTDQMPPDDGLQPSH